jgi:hypothetical protein
VAGFVKGIIPLRYTLESGEKLTGEKKPLDYASPGKDGGARTPHGCGVVLACLGLLPLLLGSRWLYFFVHTDYRAHHR